MKIAIAADLHIGANKFKTTNEKWCEPVVELVDYAIENKIDKVVFAGDVMNDRRPTTWASQFLSDQLERLANAGIEILGADGNHDDGVAADSVSATWHVMGTWARKHPEARYITNAGSPVNIVLLPWVTPQAYGISGERGLKQQLEDTQFHAIEHMKELIAPDATNILIGHAMVAYGSGEDDLAPSPGLQWAGKDVVFDYHTLAKGFDGVFLGHVHDPESMGYVGSSQPTDWGDAGQRKSFQVIDTDYMKQVTVVPYKTSLKLLDHNHKTAAALANLTDHYDIGRWHYHVEGEEQEPTVEELARVRSEMELHCDVVESITVTKDRTVVQRVNTDASLAAMDPGAAMKAWLRHSSIEPKASQRVHSKFNSLLEAHSKQ